MECEELKKNLFGIVEGSLPSSAMAEIGDHLDSCSECSRVLAGFRQTIGMIEEDISAEPDPFTGTRILQRLESAYSPEHHARKRSFYNILQPAVLSLSLILAVLIGFSIGKKGISSIPPTSAEQEIESVRADLFINDMTDEDKILILNPK